MVIISRNILGNGEPKEGAASAHKMSTKIPSIKKMLGIRNADIEKTKTDFLIA
jgi:hypothetical protein